MSKVKLFIMLCLLVLCDLTNPLYAKAAATAQWSQIAQGGIAILIRHAIAPGFSDPAGFRLEDCTTQRNLSTMGQQQARDIGAEFRRRGITIDAVYTSQWCRCRETARLLGLGPVTPLPMLNSFFEARGQEKNQTEKVSRFLQTIPHSRTIILVTHQVNITALTGIYPSSGEAVLVQLTESATLPVLGRLPFPP